MAKAWVVLVALALGATACGDDGGEGDGSLLGPATGAVCDPAITYESFGQAFMDRYCLGCHSLARHEGGHSFVDRAEIKEHAEHIDQVAGSGPNATNTAMPRGNRSVSLEDRQKLSKWLACERELP